MPAKGEITTIAILFVLPAAGSSVGVTGRDVIEMALFLGACLGALYLAAKIKTFVRAETDRALAARKLETDKLLEDYKREGEKLLDAVRRQSDELGLFTRERYRAYPRVYRQYRIAGDAWIRAAKTSDAEERERRAKTARRRVTLAKRTEIKEDLYLSDAVRDYVEIARQRVAAYSAQVITHQQNAASKVLLKKESAMDRALYRLQNVMTTELRTAQDAQRPTTEEWAS